jgi:hypothetical protein
VRDNLKALTWLVCMRVSLPDSRLYMTGVSMSSARSPSACMRIAETGSLLVPNLRDPTFAMMEIPMQRTGARQLAQSSAASTAPAEQPQRQIGAHEPVATA